jgi:hypothetical protein
MIRGITRNNPVEKIMNEDIQKTDGGKLWEGFDTIEPCVI